MASNIVLTLTPEGYRTLRDALAHVHSGLESTPTAPSPSHERRESFVFNRLGRRPNMR